MTITLSPSRASSIATVVLLLCATGSAGCAASSETEDGIGEDEQAITTEVAVSGDCLDFGPGAANPVMKATPVTFRVQVYKTLVRVWVPEVSPGVEFAPLGGHFAGRDEYRTGDGPPSNPGIRTVNYRYWKLGHASASDPMLELRLNNAPTFSMGSTVRAISYDVRVDDYQIVTRFDPSMGYESLWISMKVADWHREWGGPRVDNLSPYVVCQAALDKLPAP